MKIDYDGKIFASTTNSATGEVDSETRFHYHEQGGVVWAEYSGGRIQRGLLLAVKTADGSLDMRYMHLNDSGTIMTGTCRSRLEILPDGRHRLRERWRWTCGLEESGESVVEEVEDRNP